MSLCLDAGLEARAYTLDYNGGVFQRWTTETAPSGVFLVHDRIALCLAGDSTDDGDLYAIGRNGGDFQRWRA
jgi:hypothetical protein